MIQNLKVDIIYHRAASDFEMEFNLCGCCRMRLLSDKTTDKKSFITALARDVSRSRVIMACGPLFGDDGLIKMVGMAIGNGTAVCNNKTYGINDDSEISIIDGSTPLVTPDGYFGGCIIESGPQTIILLTENKTFRKSIMQNLIHPYLEEICYIPVKTSPFVPAVEDVPEPAQENNQQYLTTPDEEYVEEAPIEEVLPQMQPFASDEHNIEFVMDDGAVEKADANGTASVTGFDDTYKLYTDIETPEEIKERYEKPYKPSENDKMFISGEDKKYYEEESPKAENKKDNVKSLNIVIIILVLLLMLSILALVYFIVIKPQIMGIPREEYLREIFGIAKANVKLL